MRNAVGLASTDLFADPAPKHDPGGKVETKLPPGMRGAAEFYGDNDQYRLWLSRDWGELGAKYILWDGMNPSTARHDVNDPTVTREVNFTKAWGYSSYRKVNEMDFRATSPADLLRPFVVPRSDRNLEIILRLAEGADKIIICHGVITKKFQHYADETLSALLAAGHRKRIFCLGRTLTGKPRHPLYLSSDTKPETYP